eukprot:m.539386 g.539386  ORF g.539386 m.539386 type:complete len:147 (+) comp57632_c0_seq7:1237-1677(+)
MITCISPAESAVEESLNSLKYAERARRIQNKPIVNHSPQEEIITNMMKEIDQLRQQLQSQAQHADPLEGAHEDMTATISSILNHNSQLCQELEGILELAKSVISEPEFSRISTFIQKVREEMQPVIETGTLIRRLLSWLLESTSAQ